MATMASLPQTVFGIPADDCFSISAYELEANVSTVSPGEITNSMVEICGVVTNESAAYEADACVNIVLDVGDFLVNCRIKHIEKEEEWRQILSVKVHDTVVVQGHLGKSLKGGVAVAPTCVALTARGHTNQTITGGKAILKRAGKNKVTPSIPAAAGLDSLLAEEVLPVTELLAEEVLPMTDPGCTDAAAELSVMSVTELSAPVDDSIADATSAADPEVAARALIEAITVTAAARKVRNSELELRIQDVERDQEELRREIDGLKRAIFLMQDEMAERDRKRSRFLMEMSVLEDIALHRFQLIAVELLKTLLHPQSTQQPDSPCRLFANSQAPDVHAHIEAIAQMAGKTPAEFCAWADGMIGAGNRISLATYSVEELRRHEAHFAALHKAQLQRGEEPYRSIFAVISSAARNAL